jgi:DNA polymerase-3 subunit gamma/tau
VLEAEGLDFQAAALPLLARAADGSMRDGLSLLDQAIAFGGGRVDEPGVRAMLGTLPGDLTLDLLAALAAGDGARILAEVERVASLTPDFEELLRDLIGLLHRLAILQQVPATLPPDDPDAARLTALARQIPAADLQLYYQVALTGQSDLPLAPDPRAGFEMVLLRALAFRPALSRDAGVPIASASVAAETARSGSGVKTAGGGAGDGGAGAAVATLRAITDSPRAESRFASEPTGERGAGHPPSGLSSHADWLALIGRLELGGIASQIAHHCDLLSWSDGRLVLSLDPTAEHLRSPSAESRLQGALEKALGTRIRLEIQVARPRRETLAQRRERETDERQRDAVATMAEDPVARALRDELGADWIPGSIKPVD